MNKLERSVKTFNVVYTNTNNCQDDLEKVTVNYDNCISLYNLIMAFNKMHMSFKKEYDKLDKFDLLKDFDVKGFTKYTDVNGNNFRVLDMLVYNANTSNYFYLYMREVNGVSLPFITNEAGSIMSDNGYYRKFIRLDAKKVKKYLDLFEKYELLFDLYRYLRNRCVFSDGTYTLFTEIDNKDNKFVEEMDSFSVNLGSNYYDDEGDHINITVNLGNELMINLPESKIDLDGEEVIINNELCLDILKKVFINGEYLDRNKNISLEEKHEKVKMLINNI